MNRLDRHFRLKRSEGFSLLELVVAVTIIGVVATASAGLLAQSLRAARRSAELTRIKQQGDNATIALVRALREGTKLVGVDCDYPITTASICFESINPDTGARESRRINVNSSDHKLYLQRFPNLDCSSGPTTRKLVDGDVAVGADNLSYQCKTNPYKRDRIKIWFTLENGDLSRVFHVAAMLRNK